MEEPLLYLTPRFYIVHEELMAKVDKEGGFLPASKDELHARIFKMFDWMTELLESHPRTHIKRRIYSEIINSDKVNAFSYASQVEGHLYDFIGVNVGAIASAFEICSRLMSLPTFLPDVGNPEVELAERAFDNSYYHESALHVNRPICSPIDPVRRIYAFELSMAMLQFIYLHEAAHLCNGHLEFVALRGSSCYMMESKVFDRTKLAPIIWQTLEMDADASAIANLLYFNHMEGESRFSSLHGSPAYLSASTSLLGSSSNLVRTCLLASSLFYRLFQGQFYNVDWDPYMQESLPWPAVPMREHLTNLSLLEMLKRNHHIFGLEDAEIGQLMIMVGSEIEKAMAGIETRDFNMVYISPIMSPHTSKYIARLKETWNDIRPSLVPNVRRGAIP